MGARTCKWCRRSLIYCTCPGNTQVDGSIVGSSVGQDSGRETATVKTLRDEFAVQAFGPILAFKIAQFGHPCPTVYEWAAQYAYEAAEIAMMKAREVKS